MTSNIWGHGLPAHEKKTFNTQYKHIPHYDIKGAYQSITYRLADSLPANVLKTIIEAVDKQSLQTKQVEDLRRQKIEKYLDAGQGSCILQRPHIARIVIDNWQFFNKQRYDLIAYVVMPNHVHVLIKTYQQWTLQKVMHSWKSYTAKEIKRLMFKMGEPPIPPEHIWQASYWDRFIRNDQHFFNTIDYIHNNPVKAGLCQSSSDWLASSISGSMGEPPLSPIYGDKG